MSRRSRRPPPIDPARHVPDVFANGFDVHDWEDWLRLICWVDVIESDSDGGRAARREAAAIVMPRSAVYGLIEHLRFSAARHPTDPLKHS